MKTFYKSLSVLILVLVAGGFYGCEEKPPRAPETGSLELFLSASDLDESALKSLDPDSLGVCQFHALLTVIGEDSIPVLEDELVPLYKFGDGYFSKKIELKTGHYQLTKFMIIDPAGEVIYAAPVEGSPKAYLVKDPLPIGFTIEPDHTTRLRPEVLPVNGEPPSEFGYASFGFSIVKPLPFFITVMIDDPMIMAPVLITDAALSVYHPDGWHHDFYLEAKVNRVVIRGGADHYKLIVEKDGYKPAQMVVSAGELLATSESDPLIVRLGPLYHVLKLKPGPEAGKDAMISNLEPDKNFGDHPFFEATFISEPILTVMRENRSLIHFSPTGLPKSATIQKVTLTLYFKYPVPCDTIYNYVPNPCDSIVWPPFDTVITDAYHWYGGVLQQIVEPWEEHEVTWDKQPKTIVANQVYVNHFIRNVNFIEIDVTRLFIPEMEIAAPNYGMLFKLTPSPSSLPIIRFPGFRFASSDYPEPRMHPMLKIFYTLPID
jgi:hypothetical protein